jgi:hypothetical protein
MQNTMQWKELQSELGKQLEYLRAKTEGLPLSDNNILEAFCFILVCLLSGVVQELLRHPFH